MPTTTRGFVYPAASDPIGEADVHQGELAQSIDDYHGVAAKLARSAVQSIPDAGALVTWTPGSSTLSPEFTFTNADQRLLYTGPTRWFMVTTEGDWPAQSDSGTRTMSLVVTGTGSDSEFDDINPSAVPGTRGNKIRRLVQLYSGDYLTLTATQFTGSAKNFRPWLKIVGL